MKIKLLLVCALGLAWLGMMFLFTPVALAATCASQQSGDWSTASTWTNCGGGVPQSGDDVTIQAGHSITVTTPVTFTASNTLTISGTLAIELSGVLTSTASTVVVKLTSQKGAEIRVALSGGLDAAFQSTGSGAFDLSSLDSNGSVNYYGTDQTVTDRNYFSVYFNGTGTKTWTFASDRTVLYSGVNIKGATNVTFVGSSTLYDYGRWQNDSTGTFSVGNITVNFKNNAPMPIQGASPTTFYNVTINGSGTITQSQKITITGSLNVTSGTFQQMNDLVVQGGLQNNATFNATNFSMWIGGNFTNNSTLNSGTSTVTFNGSALQFISGSSAPTFYNVTVANTNGARFDHDATINHNFVVNGGSSVQMGGGVTLTCKGDFQNDGAFDVSNNDTTVAFGGTAAQSLSGTYAPIFKHLTINNTVGVNLNKDIEVRGNLTNNGIFNTGVVTVNLTGVSPQTIGGTSPITFDNLGTWNSTGVTFTQNATINCALNLYADLFTGSNILTLGSGASITPNGEVVGTVRRLNPSTGTSLFFNNAATLITFSTAPSQMDMTLIRSAPPELDRAIGRYYTLTPSGSVSATIQLGYKPSEVPGAPFNEANNALWRYDTGLSRWVLQGGTVNTGWSNYHWLSLDGVSQFSNWAMSDNGAPNSVTLSSFTARGVEQTSYLVLLAMIGLSAAGIGALMRMHKR